MAATYTDLNTNTVKTVGVEDRNINLTPSSLGSTTYASSTLTVDFVNQPTGIFSATIDSSMNTISFSNGVTGGQYVIYISASGGTRTIASTLGGTTNRTNYTTTLSLATTSSAVMTVSYDGTRYLIACSIFS